MKREWLRALIDLAAIQSLNDQLVATRAWRRQLAEAAAFAAAQAAEGESESSTSTSTDPDGIILGFSAASIVGAAASASSTGGSGTPSKGALSSSGATATSGSPSLLDKIKSSARQLTSAGEGGKGGGGGSLTSGLPRLPSARAVVGASPPSTPAPPIPLDLDAFCKPLGELIRDTPAIASLQGRVATLNEALSEIDEHVQSLKGLFRPLSPEDRRTALVELLGIEQENEGLLGAAEADIEEGVGKLADILSPDDDDGGAGKTASTDSASSIDASAAPLHAGQQSMFLRAAAQLLAPEGLTSSSSSQAATTVGSSGNSPAIELKNLHPCAKWIPLLLRMQTERVAVSPASSMAAGTPSSVSDAVGTDQTDNAVMFSSPAVSPTNSEPVGFTSHSSLPAGGRSGMHAAAFPFDVDLLSSPALSLPARLPAPSSSFSSSSPSLTSPTLLQSAPAGHSQAPSVEQSAEHADILPAEHGIAGQTESALSSATRHSTAAGANSSVSAQPSGTVPPELESSPLPSLALLLLHGILVPPQLAVGALSLPTAVAQSLASLQQSSNAPSTAHNKFSVSKDVAASSRPPSTDLSGSSGSGSSRTDSSSARPSSVPGLTLASFADGRQEVLQASGVSSGSSTDAAAVRASKGMTVVVPPLPPLTLQLLLLHDSLRQARRARGSRSGPQRDFARIVCDQRTREGRLLQRWCHRVLAGLDKQNAAGHKSAAAAATATPAPGTATLTASSAAAVGSTPDRTASGSSKTAKLGEGLLVGTISAALAGKGRRGGSGVGGGGASDVAPSSPSPSSAAASAASASITGAAMSPLSLDGSQPPPAAPALEQRLDLGLAEYAFCMPSLLTFDPGFPFVLRTLSQLRLPRRVVTADHGIVDILGLLRVSVAGGVAPLYSQPSLSASAASTPATPVLSTPVKPGSSSSAAVGRLGAKGGVSFDDGSGQPSTPASVAAATAAGLMSPPPSATPTQTPSSSTPAARRRPDASSSSSTAGSLPTPRTVAAFLKYFTQEVAAEYGLLPPPADAAPSSSTAAGASSAASASKQGGKTPQPVPQTGSAEAVRLLRALVDRAVFPRLHALLLRGPDLVYANDEALYADYALHEDHAAAVDSASSDGGHVASIVSAQQRHQLTSPRPPRHHHHHHHHSTTSAAAVVASRRSDHAPAAASMDGGTPSVVAQRYEDNGALLSVPRHSSSSNSGHGPSLSEGAHSYALSNSHHHHHYHGPHHSIAGSELMRAAGLHSPPLSEAAEAADAELARLPTIIHLPAKLVAALAQQLQGHQLTRHAATATTAGVCGERILAAPVALTSAASSSLSPSTCHHPSAYGVQQPQQQSFSDVLRAAREALGRPRGNSSAAPADAASAAMADAADAATDNGQPPGSTLSPCVTRAASASSSSSILASASTGSNGLLAAVVLSPRSASLPALLDAASAAGALASLVSSSSSSSQPSASSAANASEHSNGSLGAHPHHPVSSDAATSSHSVAELRMSTFLSAPSSSAPSSSTHTGIHSSAGPSVGALSPPLSPPLRLPTLLSDSLASLQQSLAARIRASVSSAVAASAASSSPPVQGKSSSAPPKVEEVSIADVYRHLSPNFASSPTSSAAAYDSGDATGHRRAPSHFGSNVGSAATSSGADDSPVAAVAASNTGLAPSWGHAEDVLAAAPGHGAEVRVIAGTHVQASSLLQALPTLTSSTASLSSPSAIYSAAADHPQLPPSPSIFRSGRHHHSKSTSSHTHQPAFLSNRIVPGSPADVMQRRDRIWQRKKAIAAVNLTPSELGVPPAFFHPLPSDVLLLQLPTSDHGAPGDSCSDSSSDPGQQHGLALARYVYEPYSIPSALLSCIDRCDDPRDMLTYLNAGVQATVAEAGARARAAKAAAAAETAAAVAAGREPPKGPSIPSSVAADDLIPLLTYAASRSGWARPHAALTYISHYGVPVGSAGGQEAYLVTMATSCVAFVCTHAFKAAAPQSSQAQSQGQRQQQQQQHGDGLTSPLTSPTRGGAATDRSAVKPRRRPSAEEAPSTPSVPAATASGAAATTTPSRRPSSSVSASDAAVAQSVGARRQRKGSLAPYSGLNGSQYAAAGAEFSDSEQEDDGEAEDAAAVLSGSLSSTSPKGGHRDSTFVSVTSSSGGISSSSSSSSSGGRGRRSVASAYEDDADTAAYLRAATASTGEDAREHSAAAGITSMSTSAAFKAVSAAGGALSGIIERPRDEIESAPNSARSDRIRHHRRSSHGDGEDDGGDGENKRGDASAASAAVDALMTSSADAAAAAGGGGAPDDLDDARAYADLLAEDESLADPMAAGGAAGGQDVTALKVLLRDQETLEGALRMFV